MRFGCLVPKTAGAAKPPCCSASGTSSRSDGVQVTDAEVEHPGLLGSAEVVGVGGKRREHRGATLLPPERVTTLHLVEDTERLGRPQAPAVYHADPSEHAGGSLHDWFGRTFGRGHWKRDR
jgi:hypothetical protein